VSDRTRPRDRLGHNLHRGHNGEAYRLTAFGECLRAFALGLERLERLLRIRFKMRVDRSPALALLDYAQADPGAGRKQPLTRKSQTIAMQKVEGSSPFSRFG
jgi:hypothetical protein